MIDKSSLTPYLALWALTAAVLVWNSWKNSGAGLVLSYCFQLFMLYWLGALLHALPWTDLPDIDFVYLGLQESTHGLLAFALGSIMIGPWLRSRLQAKGQPPIVPDRKLPRLFILAGVCFYFVVAPTLGRLAGFNAVGAVGSQFVVVGISLNCWQAWQKGGVKPLLKALAPALLIPAATLSIQGFLSFGVIALSTVIIFSVQFFRPRWVLLTAGTIFLYVGVSGYTAYMRDRDELRLLIWGGESVSSRMAGIQKTFTTAEWFDSHNPDHVGFINDRLNQNLLVGNAVAYLGNTGNYAYGSTIVDAVINMVPRVIWPSKPIEAGSNGLATRFTGLEFANGTSIGVGPVMELYGNFGPIGVWLGFAILGCLIQAMDIMAGYHLNQGTWLDFGIWYLVGISFLNVSGSFVECSAGAVASIALARGFRTALRKAEQRKIIQPAPQPAPVH